MTIRLLLVDDQALLRQGLASLLSAEQDFDVVGQACNGMEAVAMSDALRPDVILMDIRMPVLDGIGATRQIHEKFPNTKILVLTTFDDDEYIVQVMDAGASGYLLKNSPIEHLAQAIRSVNCGHTQLGTTIASKVFSRLNKSVASQEAVQDMGFSARELDVLKLLGQGRSTKEIAQTLFITEGTVKNHITRILDVLDMHDRTQAALWAQRNLL
jgi:DNA-binding NarL/FixJ family response regulator